MRWGSLGQGGRFLDVSLVSLEETPPSDRLPKLRDPVGRSKTGFGAGSDRDPPCGGYITLTGSVPEEVDRGI